MKLYQFQADQAVSEESDSVLTVGVASSFGPYFMIQRSRDSSGGEMEPLYCEYDDQSNGAYGTLRRIEFSREFLRLELADATTVSAALDIDDGAWAQLRLDLLMVLEGFDALHDIR